MNNVTRNNSFKMPKKPPISKEFLPEDTLHKLETPGADVYYLANFCQPELADSYLSELLQMEGWLQRPIMVFGRQCQQNRKTIYFGETGTNYRYSGIDNPGNGQVPKVLMTLTDQVETYLRHHHLLGPDDHFNYWLGNYYQDGTDNIGMHSDDERDLVGPIVSLSFGTSRYFDLRQISKNKNKNKNKTDDSEEDVPRQHIRINLEHGSMLIMAGDTQKIYHHGIPSQKTIKQPRINITLRMVKVVD